jgi:1-acyl-sn-glycerol-3-phosphate acyltransferase
MPGTLIMSTARPVAVPNRLLGLFARNLLRLAGWHVEGTLPAEPRYVTIGAPHTSYWDLPIFLFAAAAISEGFATMNIAWLGKHTAFVGPFDGLFRRLGGIPVNRAAGHHVVKAVLHAFRDNAQLTLVMSPEGTTKRVDYWKPGFYYIARLAKVPIACGFLDYRRKVAGIGPVIYPTSDMEADMQPIREFYSQVSARHPERVGEIRFQRGETPS